MEYTYKPTVKAIQYTGSIDEVIAFIGRESLSHLEVDIYTDITTGELTICLYSVATMSIKYHEYLVKETFDDGKIEYKTMSEDEFKRYYKKVTPKSLEQTMCEFMEASHEFDQAICGTTESAADTTPGEDKPEQGGRVAKGEIYWCIDIIHGVSRHFDNRDNFDNKLYESGNYFTNPEEAGRAYNEWLLQLQYRQWRKQHDPVTLDWRKHSRFKWNITYKHNISEAAHYLNTDYRTIVTLYFSTEQLAERFYNEHKDLIHRVLGVQ